MLIYLHHMGSCTSAASVRPVDENTRTIRVPLPHAGVHELDIVANRVERSCIDGVRSFELVCGEAWHTVEHVDEQISSAITEITSLFAAAAVDAGTYPLTHARSSGCHQLVTVTVTAPLALNLVLALAITITVTVMVT